MNIYVKLFDVSLQNKIFDACPIACYETETTQFEKLIANFRLVI